jgi:hypothetical protein
VKFSQTNPLTLGLGKVFIITNVRPEDMDDAAIEFGWTMGAQPGM